MERGQAAFEYLILVGALMALLIPLFNYVSHYSAENVKVQKLDDAIQTLGKSADSLYALGPGNKEYVWINLPGSLQTYSLSGHEIVITAFSQGADSDFVYTTIGEVNGSIPLEQGTYKMKIEVLDSGVVQIEKA